VRSLVRKMEHIYKCECGAEFAYISEEVGSRFQCSCGRIHNLPISNDIYELKKLHIVYPGDRRIQ